MYIISHAEFLKVADITFDITVEIERVCRNRLVTTTRKYLMET